MLTEFGIFYYTYTLLQWRNLGQLWILNRLKAGLTEVLLLNMFRHLEVELNKPSLVLRVSLFCSPFLLPGCDADKFLPSELHLKVRCSIFIRFLIKSAFSSLFSPGILITVDHFNNL